MYDCIYCYFSSSTLIILDIQYYFVAFLQVSISLEGVVLDIDALIKSKMFYKLDFLSLDYVLFSISGNIRWYTSLH